MRKVSRPDTELGVDDAVERSSARNVYMHVLARARTDYRVLRSATALLEAGFNVSIVDIEDKNVQRSEEYVQGVCLRHIIMSDSLISTRFRKRAIFRTMQVFMRSVLKMLQAPADIYHAHDFTALPACYIAAQLRGKPLIFDAHELPLSELDVPHRKWLRIILKPLLIHMISSCAGGIGASPFYEKVLRENYHISKVSLLRNVPPYRVVEKNNRLHQRLGLNQSTRIALYQGNIQSDRGLDKLVKAASFLEDNIVIVMLGKEVEPTISQLKSLISSEGVAARVKILSAVLYEELLDWTASADLGLTLIPLDGTLNMRTCLPNKFFEYLMAGLPVLTSPVDAIAPLVTSYNLGLVAPSLEPADLGNAINSILADPIMLESMHRNALNVAQKEFYWEKESPKLIQLYEDVLKMPSKKSR